MLRAGYRGRGTFSLGMEIVSPSFERFKVVILNQEQFCPPRDFGQSDDIFGCHNWGKNSIGIKWLETRDAANYPTVQKTNPHNNYLTQIPIVSRLRMLD